ncbi:hypothetical protein PLICRDRAFT_106955 [Plicaturopsis crispa FD-325 SS-3]|nr:hypothetical protein PLICRDRAFT_106955 [Plicaturopsis crispa FD-325 SS-3]
MEASQSRAWTDGGPEHVKQEALKRQRQEGWAAVRPAIGLTIRMWILRGFLQGGLKQDHHIAVEFYDRAIEVLNWGRQVWRGVRAEDRGTVFEASFVRGVRHLRIEAYMQAYAKGNASFSLEHILEEADDIIREIDANPLPSATEYDPGFVSSFTVYPRARALTMRAFYHAQLAQRLHREKDAKAGAHFALAAGSYAEAALVYPDDDEMHVWFLHNALHQLWASSAPLRVTLPTMKRIREAMPKMGTLWAQSALAREGRDELLQQDLDAERKALRLIEEGKVGLDGFVGPGGEL